MPDRIVNQYPIIFTDRAQIIQMPAEHQIVHAGLDSKGGLYIWALVDPTHIPDKVKIYVVGTGNRLPKDAGDHIWSFVEYPFVWHIFKVV